MKRETKVGCSARLVINCSIVGRLCCNERVTHDGCALDNPDRAVAVGSVRGWRLILASLHDDDDASNQILNEVEGCPACLRGLVRWLAGSTSSAFVSIACGSEEAAIRQTEKLLAAAIDEAGGA